MASSVKVRGLAELNRAFKHVDQDLKHQLERKLTDAAQLVAVSARSRFSAIDARSAGGFRPRVKGFGRVVVEQRYRRTTGLRPDFGSLQMRRALLPALYSEQDQVMHELEDMLDTIGRKEGF